MKTARYILASPFFVLGLVLCVIAILIDGQQHGDSES